MGFPVPAEYESVLQRADGTQVAAHFAVGPLGASDGTANIAFITDITERRRVDQALAAGKALRAM